uniref:Cytochrome b n=1 Tax=Heterorhabditis bacteriophora TaxID=37862 RepID=A0A1I7W631_HETBA
MAGTLAKTALKDELFFLKISNT